MPPYGPYKWKDKLNIPADQALVSMSEEEENAQCTGAMKEIYIEKQKQLSDWYYIKTKTVAVVHNYNKKHTNKIKTPSTVKSFENVDFGNCSNLGKTFKRDLFENPSMQPVDLIARQVTTTTQKNSSNLDESRRNVITRIPTVSAKYTESDDLRNSLDMETKLTYVKNSSLSRQYAPSSRIAAQCIISPPYYCPPDYATSCLNCLNERNDIDLPQKLPSNDVPERNAVCNVNVKLLKEQYQQQQVTLQSTLLAATKTEFAKKNKNKVGLQLQHWTNTVNENSNFNTRPRKNNPMASPSCLQQELQTRLINNHIHSPNSFNNCFDTAGNNINKTSQIIIKENQREQQQNNPSKVQHQNRFHIPVAHEYLANTLTIEQSPLCASSALTTTTTTITSLSPAPSSSGKESDAQPTAAQRRTLPATSRAALRSKLIRKHPDDTSCNSLEQINISRDNICPRLAGIGNANYGVIDNRADTHFPEELSDTETEKADVRKNFSCVVGNKIFASNGCNDSRSAPADDDSHSISTAGAENHEDGVHCSKPVQYSDKNNTAATPPLDETLEQGLQQVQMQLQQNPLTRQLFGVLQDEIFQPKTSLFGNNCNLSGSYASLECPSPPGPPVCLPESRRDPQARLNNYLRNLYQELSFKEPILPQWAIPVAPGTLCAARLEPDLRLNLNSHGFSESMTVDQILVSLQTKEGSFLEAPRKCLIECPTWTSRTNLCLRILHGWAKEPPWPPKGTPVALTLFIPLNELKRSFLHYVEKELLPKGPLNPFANGSGGFNAAWNSLEALGPKLLIVLDGYVSQKFGNVTNNTSFSKKSKLGGHISSASTKQLYPSDVHELLDGKLFPEARVIITTSTTNCMELMPIVQRHIMYEGLTWGRSASILEGGQWGGPSRLLDIIQESIHLRRAVRTPLGCLAIAATYEATGGDMPMEELDVVEAILNCIAPEASSVILSELGRLALFCIKMKRTFITMAEIKMYCSSPNNIISCLDKNNLYGKTAKKKAEFLFNPMCPGMMEFLAANYISSLASRPGLLAAEITGMAIGDELDLELLKVLKFAMTLLGEQAHILLSRLTPLWLTPQIVFNLALAGGHNESNLAALCDIMGISKHPPISPLETKPLWVQVRSVPTDLMGWGMALKSPTCTLKNLEVIYQLEKQNLSESRKAIEIFLNSIQINESVSTFRLSSLIEMDVKDSEISYMANCVSKILLKPRLENFELVLTLIEEDPPMLKLQSVVAALCRTIPRQPKLCSLLLDLGLSTSQLVQLCGALEKCPNVTRLSLPHLRCERGAISALTSLLNTRPITFLSLPSCWGARDDPPSSSGVSMGSGSGSSTGTSCLIKQGSLPGVPSPRSYAPGIFSSLPRGIFVPQSSLGKSATLPRQPLEQSMEKRSCDSVVSKNWYPTPACDGGPHNSGTLHDLFLAIRDSYSKLHGLDLSKAQLSLEDSMCLGETVRLSNTLHTLKLEGSSRISEILPSILGACESTCLQMLSIGSQRLSLDDSLVVMCARALTSCSTLRLLSVDGWCFRIEHIQTLSILRAFLSLTSIRELSLANCRLQTGLIKPSNKESVIFESRSVVVLKLAGTQIILSDMTSLRGPQLLHYINGFSCLRELDLSAPARSGVESTHSSPLILGDKCIVQFFQNLHSNFGLLNTLKLCNWILHFDEFPKTLKSIGKAMRYSPISHLKLDGISVLDRPKKQRSDAAFIHCFITTLPQLRWMGISLSGKKENQIAAIGNAVLDLKGNEIEIKLSESTIEQAKLMAQAISPDGKFDIKVSTFGTSSGILIHAEKSGMKSLTRKTKDKDLYF